ncbi:uncharacterized protein ATNIH1004_005221 [Aspergillus tanneri]|uniref:Uncharacterized protein n=1 Tax=Aspergillus tanneri TaxID=1220188 RepID=A0A5M9MVF8_9EURO|nr:uncharacterized protein ATNIH1004_005221 [Aspergillus tanneri]KAA8649320.1 hypothetical protein ATNIH1004_005221 [Aspergillus tanneri]
MRPEPWSGSEIIIAVYFTSRYINPITLSCLLSRRGYKRTPSAIERKVKNIVGSVPSLRPSRGNWDVDAVDQWIDDYLRDHEAVNRLITFTLEDAKVVAQYQSVDQTLGAIEHLKFRWLKLQIPRTPPVPSSNQESDSPVIKTE